MKEIRRSEFAHAMSSLGVQSEIFDFGDLQLTQRPFEMLVYELLRSLRALRPAAVFAFHPYDVAPFVDHPDHNESGKVAVHAAAIADVAHKHPQLPSMVDRPELYLLTSRKHNATHAVTIRKKSRKRRIMYLLRHYPSQFAAETQQEWVSIFDRITAANPWKADPKHKKTQEYWQRVR